MSQKNCATAIDVPYYLEMFGRKKVTIDGANFAMWVSLLCLRCFWSLYVKRCPVFIARSWHSACERQSRDQGTSQTDPKLMSNARSRSRRAAVLVSNVNVTAVPSADETALIKNHVSAKSNKIGDVDCEGYLICDGIGHRPAGTEIDWTSSLAWRHAQESSPRYDLLIPYRAWRQNYWGNSGFSVRLAHVSMRCGHPANFLRGVLPGPLIASLDIEYIAQ